VLGDVDKEADESNADCAGPMAISHVAGETDRSVESSDRRRRSTVGKAAVARCYETGDYKRRASGDKEGREAEVKGLKGEARKTICSDRSVDTHRERGEKKENGCQPMSDEHASWNGDATEGKGLDG
jgi:hypothetical protein